MTTQRTGRGRALGPRSQADRVRHQPNPKLPDGRWKGTVPEPAPEGTVLLNREEAARLIGCSPRTVTRWVDAGHLAKYLDALRRVRFDRAQVIQLRDVWSQGPSGTARTVQQEPETTEAPVTRRW